MALSAAFAGVGCYLPGRPVTPEDIARRIHDKTGYSINNGLIERLTGVRTRHYRAENEQSSDLAVNASTQAMERAEVTAEDIDLIIFASCTQDITEPATANIIQEKLGAVNAQVLDVKNACNSFLNGLDVADSHIRTGKAKCALIAVGETLSLGIDWAIGSTDDLKSRLASLTLGDAGTAVVLKAIPAEEGRGILATRFRSYGHMWRLATVLGGGSVHQFDERYSYFVSQSQALRNAAYEFIPGVVAEVLESVGWASEDVEVGCGHQVTEEMVHGLSAECGVRSGCEILTVKECGNTAAASTGLCLARAYEGGLLKKGTKVLFVGGAAGFSVAVVPAVW